MSTDTDPERIYVVDADNRPLAVMAADEVHRQGLRHRGFMLILTDRRGRLVLHRLDGDHPTHSGHLDITGSGHVRAGESAEEAAARRLPATAAALAENLRYVLALDGEAGTGEEIVDVFAATLPNETARLLAADLSFLLVDEDELGALAASYPDQLTPDLLTVWKTRLYRP